jgi:predicted phosphodiesterase
MDYKKKSTESLDDWKIRLSRNKDLYDITWGEIADLWFEETSDKKSGDWFRKFYRYWQEGYEVGRSEGVNSDQVKEIEESIVEFEKAKIKFRDQKREYSKLLANQARFEYLQDEIRSAIQELAEIKPLQWNHNPLRLPSSKNEGVVILSDWHYGMVCDNGFNKYNADIFKDRIQAVVNKTIEYGKKNNIRTLNCAILGDMISGNIHISTRVQSNEDVIRQVQVVSETLSEVICKFANEFEHVRVVNVIGNHARTGKKDEVGIKENYEYLIPWFLQSRLSHFGNVEVITDEDGMVIDEVCGNKIVYVHGNFDHATSAAKSLPQMLGFIPKYIIGGHIHHNYEQDFGHTTYIANGSLIGMDDFAVQKRLYSRPMQKFMVFNDEGIECAYNIYLK